MNREVILRMLKAPNEETITNFLDDTSTVFWVDWREEDDAIVRYCESVLETGELSAEVVDADNDAGFEMFIQYKAKRLPVPLVAGPEDRHITLVALNQALAPDYEVRLCIDSGGSDTLAFLPLSAKTWRELEAQFGAQMAKRFYKLQAKPNVFTDPMPF